MKQLKMLLLTSMVTLFTTYVHAESVNMVPVISYLLSDTSTITPQEIAIDKIKAYADNQANPTPTAQDYIDAGVSGVSDENIADVNSIVASLMVSEVDTTVKIQVVVDSVIVLVSFASDIYPILDGNCYSCHKPSKNRTFQVDTVPTTYDNIIDKNLINTTSPDSSLILIKGNAEVSHNGGDVLSDTESTIVRNWIWQGGLEN